MEQEIKMIKKEGIFKPSETKRNILITSALPYVNNVPHLGNIIGSTLSADVFSRYCKIRGYNVLYVCGTDEYGTATETKALKEKKTPQEICDIYYKIHSETYKWFGIDFDIFGRTSTPEQTEIAQRIFLDLHERNHTKFDTVQQLYCENDKMFLADRYVEGICPNCGGISRGDQCDSCTKLINAIELKDPKCKICNQTPVIRSSKHIFLDLTEMQDKLTNWLDSSEIKKNWSSNAINVTNAWIKKGLEPRSITRDLKWGTKVPLEEFKDKVFYVWFDAPIGYISITACLTDDWELWWKNPKNVELFQFMGKDNIPFHTVIFPSTLLGTGTNWTMLKHISTTEYLTYEGQKFSKTNNIGIFGTDVEKTGIPCEVWRYYLLSTRPESADSDFNWDDLISRNNNELLKNLGNFCNRPLSFLKNNFASQIPLPLKYEKIDDDTFSLINFELNNYINAFEQCKIRLAVQIAMSISSIGNGYLQKTEFWEIFKTDKERCGTILQISTEIILLLAKLFYPIIPSISKKILDQLNLSDDFLKISISFKPHKIPKNHMINEPKILFTLIKEERAQEFRQIYGGDSKKFHLDLKGGIIISIQNHPEDSELFILKVDIGSKTKQIVARLKPFYNEKELINKKMVIVCNLITTKIKGIDSEGMCLVAENKKKKINHVQLLTPLSDVSDWNGQSICPETFIFDPIPNLTINEFQSLKIKLGKGGIAMFKDKKFCTINGVNIGSIEMGEGSIVK